MNKSHSSTRFIKAAPVILFAVSSMVSTLQAANYYHMGSAFKRIDLAGSYSNTDGSNVLAVAALSAGDDVFFYNSSASSPESLSLQTGPQMLALNSITFRKNAGTTQIDRSFKSSSDATVVQIGKGGITVESGAGAVTIGAPVTSDEEQRVVVGAFADFRITNNSNNDLTFNRVFDGRSENTTHTVTVTGSGSGNVTFVEGIRANSKGRDLAMTINTTGTGVVRFNGKNTYKGPTSVVAGKLFITGDARAAEGALNVSSQATLGGSGMLGSDVTIAENGGLEFDISAPAGKHNLLNIASSRTLNFSGVSVLTITSSGGAIVGKYKLINAPGGILGASPATLKLPAGWVGKVSIVGNNLVLDLKSIAAP